MSLFRNIETRIANLVEGSFGKVFRSNVQPVELAKRLIREMDDHQQQTVRSVYVPNEYDIFLSRDDYRQLTQFEAALTSELSEYLAEHARRSGFDLLTRPRVKLKLDRDLKLGSFGIAVGMQQPSESGAPIPADAPPSTGAGKTAIFAAPVPETAPAPSIQPDFAVFGPNGPFPLTSDRITLGRGSTNDIVVKDSSVSREHAEIVRDSAGSWELRDRDSTNGVAVNGHPTTKQRLSTGSVITLGNAELRFDRFDAGDSH